MLSEINLAQSRLERDPNADWWFLLKRVVIPITGGSPVVNLPSDYLRLAEQSIPVLFTEDGKALGKLARAYQEDAILSETDYPAYYVLEGNTMSIYPIPAENCSIQIQYVARQPELTALVLDNAWTAYGYSLLMCKAGIALAQALQHKDALSNFVADYNAAYKETFNETIARSDVTFSQVRE